MYVIIMQVQQGIKHTSKTNVFELTKNNYATIYTFEIYIITFNIDPTKLNIVVTCHN